MNLSKLLPSFTSESAGSLFDSLKGSESPEDCEQLQIYRDVFKLFDTDKDGIVSKENMKEIFEKMNMYPTDDELDKLFAPLEGKGLDFENFVDLVFSTPDKRNRKRVLKDAYKVFDVRGDGKITAFVFRYIMNKIGTNIDAEETEILFNEIGVYTSSESNGLLTFERFVQLANICNV